jgi:hypothetical protein
MEVTWTRESALQAVEIGTISTWAGTWLHRDLPAEPALKVVLEALADKGEIRRAMSGRWVRVRTGGPR